jgi:hypothetical protein
MKIDIGLLLTWLELVDVTLACKSEWRRYKFLRVKSRVRGSKEYSTIRRTKYITSHFLHYMKYEFITYIIIVHTADESISNYHNNNHYWFLILFTFTYVFACVLILENLRLKQENHNALKRRQVINNNSLIFFILESPLLNFVSSSKHQTPHCTSRINKHNENTPQVNTKSICCDTDIIGKLLIAQVTLYFHI